MDLVPTKSAEIEKSGSPGCGNELSRTARGPPKTTSAFQRPRNSRSRPQTCSPESKASPGSGHSTSSRPGCLSLHRTRRKCAPNLWLSSARKTTSVGPRSWLSRVRGLGDRWSPISSCTLTKSIPSTRKGGRSAGTSWFGRGIWSDSGRRRTGLRTRECLGSVRSEVGQRGKLIRTHMPGVRRRSRIGWG